MFCLFVFDLRPLFTLLISSNFCYNDNAKHYDFFVVQLQYTPNPRVLFTVLLQNLRDTCMISISYLIHSEKQSTLKSEKYYKRVHNFSCHITFRINCVSHAKFYKCIYYPIHKNITSKK